MRARFTIEPNDNDGVGAWVRPIDAGEKTYWKWYQTTHDALIDANDMGLGEITIVPSSDPHFAIARRSVPIEINIDPEKLEFWRFHKLDVHYELPDSYHLTILKIKEVPVEQLPRPLIPPDEGFIYVRIEPIHINLAHAKAEYLDVTWSELCEMQDAAKGNHQVIFAELSGESGVSAGEVKLARQFWERIRRAQPKRRGEKLGAKSSQEAQRSTRNTSQATAASSRDEISVKPNPLRVLLEATAEDGKRNAEEGEDRRAQISVARRLNGITGVGTLVGIVSVVALTLSIIQSRHALE